jgi:hypothetical protein
MFEARARPTATAHNFEGKETMTTKSKSQGGTKGKMSRRDIGRRVERALAIIANTRDYDADTRRIIYVELQNLKLWQAGGSPGFETPEEARQKARASADKLAGLVGRAEAGEVLADLSGADEETVREARVVLDLIERPHACPQFIYEALMVALDEAARLSGFKVWEYTDDDDQLGSGGYSLRGIVRLFERFDATAIPLEPKHDLAGHVAAVLADPRTPSRIYNPLSEAVSELASKDTVIHGPEVIRRALTLHAEEGGDS